MASARRDELVEKLTDFIAQGGQAYWVCPVIESDAEEPLQAIETAADWLAPIFKDQLVVLHGRMSTEEKRLAMQDFSQGRRRLMLSTTVIEVGVDVPRASLMVIEHSERFGLAQLHQLRGRIGRGAAQSTCILLFDEPLSDVAKERLKTLYETDDGFEVARRDLAIRGPGEVLQAFPLCVTVICSCMRCGSNGPFNLGQNGPIDRQHLHSRRPLRFRHRRSMRWWTDGPMTRKICLRVDKYDAD